MRAPLLLQHQQRALDRTDRGLGDVAVFGGEGVGARSQILKQRLQVLEIDQRQLLVVGDLEGDIEHAFLGLAQIHESRQQQRSKLRDRRPDRVPLLAEQVPEDHRIGLVLDGVADLLGARLDPALGLALLGDAREIALHVGAEHRHALIGETFRQALQRHGLAGAGGAGDQAVAVGEPEPDELRLDALADIDAVGGSLGSASRFGRLRPPSALSCASPLPLLLDPARTLASPVSGRKDALSWPGSLRRMASARAKLRVRRKLGAA